MTTDQTIEEEIQAKGLTAPRITPADIEANIASVHYFTAEAGAFGAAALAGDGESSVEEIDYDAPDCLSLLTFCVLVLKNGFTVTGESACAASENFDAEIDKKIARANAVQKIWPLMGYELRTRLSPQPPAASTFEDRVRAERAELDDRLDKLIDFRSTSIFAGLPVEEQERLDAQRAAMTDYSNTLHERIAAFSA